MHKNIIFVHRSARRKGRKLGIMFLICRQVKWCKQRTNMLWQISLELLMDFPVWGPRVRPSGSWLRDYGLKRIWMFEQPSGLLFQEGSTLLWTWTKPGPAWTTRSPMCSPSLLCPSPVMCHIPALDVIPTAVKGLTRPWHHPPTHKRKKLHPGTE